MRVSPLGAMVVASSLVLMSAAAAQTPSPAKPASKPAAKPPAAAPKPAPAPAPSPASPSGKALDIKGFRSATFGMTPAQVKAAVTSDFGPTAQIQEAADPSQGTQIMVVKVDHLDPGPGPAQIGYVFGATSKTLNVINVVWATGPEPTEQERSAIAQAGQQLAAYFQTGPAPARTMQGMRAFGANGLILYTAADAKNSGIMVTIDGIEYHGTTGDKTVASPAPKGPATLRVGYELDASKPDVKVIKPGAF